MSALLCYGLLFFVSQRLSAAPTAVPTQAKAFKLTLTKNPATRVPATSFSCSDKIYALLRLPEKATGQHLLSADWYRPDGRRQEATKVEVSLSTAGEDTVLLWLKMEVPQVEDTVDVFFPNPDDGEVFNGEWHADFFWDNKKAQSVKFEVACP